MGVVSVKVPDDMQIAWNEYCSSLGVSTSELMKEIMFAEMQNKQFASVDTIRSRYENNQKIYMFAILRNMKKFTVIPREQASLLKTNMKQLTYKLDYYKKNKYIDLIEEAEIKIKQITKEVGKLDVICPICCFDKNLCMHGEKNVPKTIKKPPLR